MTAPELIVAVPLLSLLGVAASIDLVDRRIPNGLSLAGALVGFATHAYLSGSDGFFVALAGWALCLACFLPLYASGGLAAGDVKLMGMVGAFLGPVDGFIACLVTLVAGAILASVSVGWTRLLQRLASLRWAPAGLVNDSSDAPAAAGIPYAVAIALGAVAVVLQPEWLANALPLEVLQ